MNNKVVNNSIEIYQLMIHWQKINLCYIKRQQSTAHSLTTAAYFKASSPVRSQGNKCKKKDFAGNLFTIYFFN